MEVQRCNDGYFTLTFSNHNCIPFNTIKNDFSTIGRPQVKCNVNQSRYYIKYDNKEDAEAALSKYGKVYNAKPQIRRGRETDEKNHQTLKHSSNHNGRHEQHQPRLTISHNLILGNLPKNYTTEQVKYLIEEIQYKDITEIGETKLLKLKFCQITLNSDDDLKYLIKKLDEFILCGEKLIAIDEKDLIAYHEIFTEKVDRILPSPSS